MNHTLTSFMELMDHGIVSWENLSSVFIKKVLYLSLPTCCLFTDITVTGCFTPTHLLSSHHSLLLFSFQIAGFVNNKLIDASIQQVSMDILESMVLSSHSLFLQVKQEVTMERLIAHIQV